MASPSSTKRYEDMREKMKEDLLQRQAMEKPALRTVMNLLEGDITEEQLITAAQTLTPQYYRDAAEERGLALCCGYPICRNKLKPLNHKKKYHISTHSNKVYDVTERKYFCSPACYKASKYLENQICEEPLWSRGNNFECDIHLLRADNSNVIQDESVVIDTSTVYMDPNKTRSEELAGQMLESLTLDETTEAHHVDFALDDDKLSDGESTDEETTPAQQPAEDLLKSRKSQRLNLYTDTDTSQQGVSVSAEDWVGSMLTRTADTKSEGQRGCVAPSAEDSLALSHKQSAADSPSKLKHGNQKDNSNARSPVKQPAGKKNQIHSLPAKTNSITEEEHLNRFRRKQAAQKSANSCKTVLLDSYVPTPHTTGGHEDVSVAKKSGCVRLCINRLKEWFTDESIKVLFDPTNSECQELAEAANQNASTDKEVEEDNPLLPLDEVKLSQPNIDSVSAQQRKIVFHRILKSCERVGGVLSESETTAFRDKLGRVTKTLRLDRDNIIAHPVEWNVITLLLSACVHHSDAATVNIITEEINRLTNERNTNSTQDIQTFLLGYSTVS